MDVRVREARKHRCSACVDHSRVRTFEREHGAVTSDEHDAAGSNRNRVRVGCPPRAIECAAR